MRVSLSAGIMSWVLAASLASAAAEKVIVVSGTPNASVVLVRPGGGGDVVIDTNVKSPTGVVLDGDDAIVTYFDGVARYRNALNAVGHIDPQHLATLHKADGPSIDPKTGDLFLLAQFDEHTKLVRLQRNGAGFDPPTLVSGQLKLPQDTVVVETTRDQLVQGDVLVVVDSPAPGILRFNRAQSFAESRFTELPGMKPTGITLSVAGNDPEILVSDAQSGLIRRVSFSGSDFDVLSNTPYPGLSKLETTLAGSDLVAYATREAELLRFVVDGSRGPAQQIALAGLTFTDGIGAVHVAPTFAGAAEVAPAFGLELFFDNVEIPGLTAANISFVTLDGSPPPPAGGGKGKGKKNPPAPECALVLESGNCVEAGIAPPLAADPRIPVVHLDSTAAFGRTVLVRGEEHAVLGASSDDDSEVRADWTDELVRWLYAPEVRSGESAIAECFDTSTASGGCTFLDVTVGYGSHYSRGMKFSEWVMAKDRRFGSEEARLERKAEGLSATLGDLRKQLGCKGRSKSGDCALVRELEDLLDAFLQESRAGNHFDADAIVVTFLDAISSLPGDSGNNVEGELRVRGVGLKFSNCVLGVQDGTERTLGEFEDAINACVADPGVPTS